MTAELVAAMEKHDNKATCLAGTPEEKSQQNWVIDDKGGVGDVFVWLKPPKGSYFKLNTDDLKSIPKEVTLNQPHCAFMPHAVIIIPSYYDPETKKQKPTGQVFKVTNEAPVNHNTKWEGGRYNRGGNQTIGSKQSFEIKLQPSNDPVKIRCDIHSFMSAVARVYDHPFVAKTHPDGTYEIKNVPLGVPLNIVAWHEEGEWAGSPDGQSVTLKDGDTIDFKLKAP
jgi:hypothetical protein